MKIVVQPNELAIVYKKGVFNRFLLEGSYRVYFANTQIISRKTFIESTGVDILNVNKKGLVTELLQTIEVKDNFIALHFIDGIYDGVLKTGRYTFINKPYLHSFIYLDLTEIKISDDIPLAIVKKVFSSTDLITNVIVLEGTVGALYVDGVLKEFLQPGNYYFLKEIRKIVVKMISTKPQIINVNGQEILSKDKITLRFNLVLNYQVIDPLKLIKNHNDYNEELYLLLQMKYREYLSEKSLDEILAERESIGKLVLTELKKYEDDYGIVISYSGIKDLILPGDIRDILNTVLIAEKKAMANVITRREETASTRSLLNTAKLMEENKTLYRLKELEYLEKIFDKVQTLSLSSSSNALEQLTSLINSDKK